MPPSVIVGEKIIKFFPPRLPDVSKIPPAEQKKVMEGGTYINAIGEVGTYINPIGEVGTYGTIAFAKEKISTVEIDEDDIHLYYISY